MELWQAVILGLVEGVTEYLPISSTGHLILASGLMGLDTPAQKASVDAFNIVIQGGAILAVLGLYSARVLQMLRGLIGRDAAGRRLAINIIVAFIPAAVLGVLLDDLIERWLFHPIPVLAALALGGVYMILLDRWKIRVHLEKEPGHDETTTPATDITDLTWRQALIIGFMQTLAMIPGTSRSMMTITGGVLVGLKPKQAAEFSFLLGLPTLGGACVYKLAKNLKESHEAGTPNMFEVIGWAPIVVGLLVATASAALAVKWLVAFLTRHGLEPFGWYRLGLCVVLGGAIAMGWVEIGGGGADTPGETPTVQDIPADAPSP